MTPNFMGGNVGFGAPGADQQIEIQRRLKMAEALQNQAMQPIQQTAPIHPFQGLAKMGQAYTGAMQGNRAQELAKALGQQQTYRRGADMSSLVNALGGRKAQPAGLSEDASGNVTPTDPMAAQSPMQSLQQAIPLMGPEMQPVALQAMIQQMPKQPQPFTLTPGATRYGPEGNQIASAPVAPKPPEPFTLSPGAVRYGADGKQIAESKYPPKPLVDIDMKGEGKYHETVGKMSGERDIGQHEAAVAAIENVNKLNLTLDQISSSDAITGMGADVLKNVERMKTLFLKDQQSGKRVSDTELLDALLGSDVFPMIKAMGIGARGLDTPAEREFLRNVMTGTTPMNRETLRQMTEIRRDISVRAIERWNERVGSGELDRYFSATQVPKRKLDVPKRPGGELTPAEQRELDELRQRFGRGR